MATITKEYFRSEWERDWVLRALVIDHYVYWRGNRVGIQHLEGLKRFLAQHSIAHTKSEIDGFLTIYASRGIFTNPNAPSPETGLINPDAYKVIVDTMLEEYNLDRVIQSGYTIADFMWDAYGHKHDAEIKMAHNFEILFKDIFGFDTVLFAERQGQKDEHDYLRLTWKDGTNQYAWWIGFLAGGYLKREDAIAEGLTTKAAFKIRTLSTSAQYTEQFWTVCAVDVSKPAISTSQEINDTFNLGAYFNLVLVISLVKLLTWGEKTRLSNFQRYFSRFFSDQDCPISTSIGIRNIEKAAKESGKNKSAE